MANMTKAQMAELIARMSEELEALKAEKASATQKTAPAEKPQTSPKGKASAKATEKVVKAETSAKVVLPVRKGKTVSFDGWLNYKVWSYNKPLMGKLGGEYDKTTRSIVFPSAKAATAFCGAFVPTLSEAQYADQKAKIAEGFEARRAEKAASSEGKTSKKSSAKKADLIRKGKGSAKSEASTPVKKPEWKERAGKGEKPFANYSTYKEYWHSVIGK